MSLSLWQELPAGFLKKGYRGWTQFDPGVQLLIVELAKTQNFKCAFCTNDRNLEIEHDHDPDEGDGERPTIRNIRGLACRRCNWHLSLYERDQRGEYTGWGHVDCFITDYNYEDYIYAYDCRLRKLHEDAVKKTCPNYWSRRLLLDKFDRWKDGWGDYPWNWGFEEIKEKRHGKIRTPKQFIRVTSACVKFVAAEFEKDSNYRPPDDLLKFIFRAKLLLDEIRPFIEARLIARGYDLAEL
jgi:hypothetical protein